MWRVQGRSGSVGGDGRADEPSFSFLVTMLTMLDFGSPGKVNQDDWDRGMNHLWCPGMASQVSWGTLLKRFDKGGSGEIDFGEILGLAPLDPRLEQLLRVLLQTLVRLSEKVDMTMNELHKSKLQAMRKQVNMWRNEAVNKTFVAWKKSYVDRKAWHRSILADMKLKPCRKCLHAIRAMLDEKKSQMKRAASMMRGGETRLQQQVLVAWRDAHNAEKEERTGKLRMYFGSREDFWLNHVMQTWKRHIYQERVSRSFVVKWAHHGKAKVFLGWKRFVQREVSSRIAGQSRAVTKWLHSTLYQCMGAWAQETRRVRDERDAVLRAQLMRRGATMGARYARGWFEAGRARQAKKRLALAKLSLLGASFRGWGKLIEARRRREMLEWLFGDGLEGLHEGVQTAARPMIDELQAAREHARQEAEATSARLREEIASSLRGTMEAVQAAVQGKAARAQLEAVAAGSSRAVEAVEALAARLDEQARAAASASEQQHGTSASLQHELRELAREVTAAVQGAERGLRSELAETASHEQARLAQVQDEVRLVQRTKASHGELRQIIAKLEHRAPPGGPPIAVQQLLAIPYPMPPSSTTPRSRPSSASRGGKGAAARRAAARPSSASPRLPPARPQPHGPGPGVISVEGSIAELREVPTDLFSVDAQAGGVYTTEQLIVGALPADAVEAMLSQRSSPAPPSSGGVGVHLTPRSSPRGSRPGSARTEGAKAQIALFERKTERILRTLQAEAAPLARPFQA